MKYIFYLLTIAYFLSLVSLAKANEAIDFSRDIQPILNSKCVECHGGVRAAGDVSFVYEDRVVNYEGDTGEVVVVPGDASASELFRRVISDDEDEVMPKPEAHPRLTNQEIALIERWINEGASWSGHWAFEPPRLTMPGKSKFESKARGPIDRYLFTRLEQEGLRPSQLEPSPGRLLRRLSLALTGLPPSLDQLTQFERAFERNTAAAIENAVDRLIDSPAFGERWASMWLDLVRYADSGGLGLDQRRSIWPYRDWVVRAFNQDLPYDQFTVMQLAGDLLPDPTLDDWVATACHRNTQTNNEGGTDDEEFRVEAVLDRVNTTWQAWGSITFGCVQCHDHPYDPFRQEEYYQFVDFFNSTADSDLPHDEPRIRVPRDRQRHALWTQYDADYKRLRELVFREGTELRDKTNWLPVKNPKVSSQNGVQYVVDKDRGETQFHTVGTVSENTTTKIKVNAQALPDKPVTALRLAVLPLDPEQAIHSPEWGFWITDLKAYHHGTGADGKPHKKEIKFRWSVPDVPWLPDRPGVTIGPSGKDWAAHTRIHRERQIVLIPEQPLSLADDETLGIDISCSQSSGGAHPLVIKRGHLAVTTKGQWTRFANPKSNVWKWHHRAVDAFVKKEKLGGTHVPIMVERPNHLRRSTHVFAGGNQMDKAQQVATALPKSFMKVAPAPSDEQLNRLHMAKWWVSGKHPLTSRVFVNRVWAQLFGVGIVPTLEDFGSSGEPPTHPELLDYLALRFQNDYRWSFKSLVREIVLSHAFLQEATVTKEMSAKDQDNRLLVRGPRLRLSAEAVRDNALAVSGLLSADLGGPPVRPPLPGGVWKPFDGGDQWKTAKPDDPQRYRRSIYVYMKRSIPFPTFASFDAPSREFCSPRRLNSNTPLQALVTLNDRAFVECAESFGKQIKDGFAGTLEQRLTKAYQVATGRKPNSKTLDHLIAMHSQLVAELSQLTYDKPESDESSGGKKPSPAKPSPTDAPQQLWTVMAQVLLNADDALTY